jgi:hypothetical protein
MDNSPCSSTDSSSSSILTPNEDDLRILECRAQLQAQIRSLQQAERALGQTALEKSTEDEKFRHKAVWLFVCNVLGGVSVLVVFYFGFLFDHV